MIRVPKNKVAVDPMFDPDTTASGLLYIPDVAKERADQGIVRYVGESVHEIKVGDYVLFSGWTGTTVQLEGEGILIILPEEFVTARIDAPDTDVPGLYFKSSDGEYFTATHEQAIYLINRNAEERYKHRIKQVQPKPEVKDYDRLR